MADKFEFQNMQHSSPIVQIKKKPSLLEYKQVIIELSDAVSSFSQDNEKLHQ